MRSLGQLKEDLKQLPTKEELSTQLGDLWEVTAAAIPDGRQAIIWRAPEDLAAACGLPHDEAASSRLAAALTEEPEAAHSFGRLLFERVQAKASAGQVGLSAALSRWRSLPPPNTAAAWKQQADVLGQVAANLEPNSELHQAVLLLRNYSTAAAEAEESGCPDALLRLLSTTPQPGARAWPPAMTMLLAYTKKWSREMELNAPLRLQHGADGRLVIREAKVTAKGVAKATHQLRQAFRAVAWVHAALGAPLPQLEGRIVVPAHELREAERLLRGARGVLQETVPGRAGTKFSVTIKVATV